MAAITLALYEHCGGTAHDPESGKLTVVQDNTEWNSKLRTQRQLPVKHF